MKGSAVVEEILKQILKSQQNTQKTLEKQGQTLEQHSNQVNSFEDRQSRFESRMESLDKNQLKLEAKLENEIVDKIRSLYDARSVQEDINTRIIDTLERIEAKIDILQIETAHVRKSRRSI